MVFLDDGPDPGPAGQKADRRYEALRPEDIAVAVIEIGSLGEVVAAKGLALGQSRDAFLVSMSRAWDQAEMKFELVTGQEVTRRERVAAPPAQGPAPPAEVG